jgi:hypothetical protein
MTPAQFYQIEMQNQQNQQAQQQQNMQNVMGGLQQLAGAYSENKQLEAKASSYDDIGKILGTAMFNQNPDAMGALSNLQKEKDPRKKVMGYDQLFSLVGPMSNMMMAQGRMGIQQQGQQIQAGMPAQRAQINAAAQVAAGQGRRTTLPSSINPDVIP